MKPQRIHFLLLILVFTALPVAAQDDPHAHHGGSIGWVPREILERPVGLRTGIGQVHDPVTTSSKDAQAFYDQGVAYLHSYVWIEAARSFHQALRNDPKLAMAWFGLSRAYTGLDDSAAARAAYEKAQELSGNASPREQRRIATRKIHLDALDDLGNQEKHLAYKKALDDALAQDLSDAELWCLRGNAEEANAAGRGQRGRAASIAFYEQAMRVVPMHFGAHHYLIHTYESIGQIDLSLKHGLIYSRAATNIPHAHHMYGHDLRRVGRIDEAIAEFTRADQLENDYYQAEKIDSSFDWHHQHNLDLLSTSFQYVGRMKKAEALMRAAFEIPATGEGAEFNKKEYPSFLLSRGRPTEAMTAAEVLAKGKWPLGRTVGQALLGQIYLSMGKTAEAESALAAAQKEFDGIRTYGYYGRSAVQPYLDSLRGELFLRAGKFEEAGIVMKKVAADIRAVIGPDAWSQALFRLEAMARAARDAGDWELAQFMAEQMLAHDSSYAGTHYALALVAKHRGDVASAQAHSTAAEKLWSSADPGLPELGEIKSGYRR